MKLYFVDKTSMLAIKENLSTLTTQFQKNSSCDWLETMLGQSPYTPTKFPEIPTLQLDMSSDKPHTTDAKNAEEVYTKLSFLSDSQASDERFWAALCMREGWPYVEYRWDKANKCSESWIKQHVFFGYGPRRSLTRNALSRLWWIGRLTIDRNNLDDPYRLTRFVCRNADNLMHTLERNTSNNPMIMHAFLSAVVDAEEKENMPMNTDDVGELERYLNLLGGTYILDCLPEQVIYDKILAKARELNKRRTEKEALAKETKEAKKQATAKKKIELPSKKKAAQQQQMREFIESRTKKKHR